MNQYRIVIGTITKSDNKGTKHTVVTAVGEVLEIESASGSKIEFHPLEASGAAGLQRILLKDDDLIHFTMTAKQLWEQTKQPQFGATWTTYKYYDDHGCISKTRDDGFLVDV